MVGGFHRHKGSQKLTTDIRGQTAEKNENDTSGKKQHEDVRA